MVFLDVSEAITCAIDGKSVGQIVWTFDYEVLALVLIRVQRERVVLGAYVITDT